MFVRGLHHLLGAREFVASPVTELANDSAAHVE